MVGAEVEHGKVRSRDRERAGAETPARLVSAVVELAAGLLRPGYHHSAARHRSQLLVISQPADWDSWACANYRRPTGRSRSFPPGGRRWRWRWWCSTGYCPSRRTVCLMRSPFLCGAGDRKSGRLLPDQTEVADPSRRQLRIIMTS